MVGEARLLTLINDRRSRKIHEVKVTSLFIFINILLTTSGGYWFSHLWYRTYLG